VVGQLVLGTGFHERLEFGLGDRHSVVPVVGARLARVVLEDARSAANDDETRIRTMGR
jgi:hypothetical protein